MKVFQSRVFAACVASAITAVVVGGVAFAAIPGSGGAITGCYDKKSGALRVIDTSKKQKCKAGTETQLKWNQKGATGPKGAASAATGCGTYPRAGVSWFVAGSKPGHGCGMTGVYLGGQNLTSANLTNVNFTNADLSTTVITGATVAGVNFNARDMSALISGGLIGTPASIPPGTKIVKGYFVGGFPHFVTGISMAGANLSGANLSGLDLSRSPAQQANFSGANFAGSSLVQVSTYPGALFTGATLTNADMSNGSFSGSTFTNANLTNANATNASFQGAIGMSTATLTGVTWFNTTCPDGSLSNSNGSTCVGHL